ncbi:CerR family C-terminal domain-containing protein [Candidatus Sumerlaeota bacterium]|nr:CerR family C-terminal domain-containing protein [Candidatus Sumerlaeota bacterium]
MRTRRDGVETRRQILEAASLAFSRKGFGKTTIAEICRLAGTNIASVNYHFGDKETLYVEAWREAFRRSHEKYPVNGGVPDGAPARERLRGWVVSLLGRIADPACHDFEIVHKEMANPTGLLVEPIRAAIDPMRKDLSNILHDLLGKRSSPENIQLCEMSIRSQCMNPLVFGLRHKGGIANRAMPEPPPFDIDVETIADHVIRFSLEGLRGVRRHVASDSRPGKTRRL